ncbi:MFS transporter [Longispora fulva]|uniref:MFS family permease n=1 Tax=Longispora fulva TaxID=619741 RepID=A0A8J7KFY5_9ACTN|nr:MFS transporter [Longispora fulva]MBG6136755.1 MFS family permease [Longispora fulva]GIG59926.1 MFS transporter [Longispora fulva]
MIAVKVRRSFIAGMLIDSVGTGLYMPFALLFFTTVSGLSLATVGVGLSVAALIGVGFSPLSGIAIDRFGARPVLLGSYAVRMVAFLSFLAVGNFTGFLIVATISGIAEKAAFPATLGLISELVEGRERDRLRALNRSVRNGGLGIGGLIAAAAIAGGGTTGYLAIAVANAASFLVAALLLIPVRGTVARQVADKDSAGYATVLRDRPYLALTGVNVLGGLAFSALGLAIPVYATGTLGVSASWIGIVFGVNTAMVSLFGVPLARLAERYRRTRIAALGALLFAASFAVMPLLGVLDLGGTALIGALLAIVALYSLGEILHGQGEGNLAVDSAPAALRGRYMVVHQLSWSASSVLAPAMFTSLLAWNSAVLWIGLAVAVGASAGGFLALERRLPARAVRATGDAPVAARATVRKAVVATA